jgi:hypothetical protein
LSRAFLDGALDHVVSLGMGEVGPRCDKSLGSVTNMLNGLRGDASVTEIGGLIVGGVSEERKKGGEDGEDAHGE